MVFHSQLYTNISRHVYSFHLHTQLLSSAARSDQYYCALRSVVLYLPAIAQWMRDAVKYLWQQLQKFWALEILATLYFRVQRNPLIQKSRHYRYHCNFMLWQLTAMHSLDGTTFVALSQPRQLPPPAEVHSLHNCSLASTYRCLTVHPAYGFRQECIDWASNCWWRSPHSRGQPRPEFTPPGCHNLFIHTQYSPTTATAATPPR